MSDLDSEVDRIMERPPSSYGSMRSDDHDDDDDHDDVPLPTVKVNLQTPGASTGVRLYRSDSPETGITALTQQQSSIHMEGAYLNEMGREQSFGMRTADEADDEFYSPRGRPSRRAESQVAMEVIPPEHQQNLPPPPEGVGLQSGIEHETLSLPYVFKAIQGVLSKLNLAELLWFKRSLCSQYKHHFEFSQLEDCDVLDVVDRLLERRGKGEALYYATRTLQNINKRPLADDLEIKCKRAIVQHELRGSHSRRYYNLYEGTCRPGQQRFVSDVFAEPSIYIGGDWDINTDHEFHKPNFSSNQGTPIRASDIFRPLEGEGQIRTVLMTGVPGIGLTVAVQKFIMDWSDGLTNQDFQFVFSIPGKEMHLVKENDHSFLEMLANFYSETKNIDFLQNEDCPILFIIDALEFCRQPLNFKDNPEVCDVTTPAPADVLFTSLIKGTLLPRARIWITCHRVAARKIPSEYVSRFTDLKGLSNEKKDEYFTKRTKVPEVGVRVLEHIKRSQAMYNFCHLPLFCWIVGFIFERRLRSPENDEHPPALTNFYAQYMIVQTNRKIERYVGVGFEASRWKDTDKDFLVKMGKLALKMILEERDVFFEDDIAAMELDMEQVANRGGISAEVRRQGGYGRSGRAFSFVHYSMQEFMAAMYTYVTYRNKGKNVFEQQIKNKMAMLLKDRHVFDLYKLAVDRALASRNGHLDIFLRFLFGFVTPGTEAHLRGYLMPQHHPVPRGLEDVVKYVNKKIKENASPDRCKNLEWCLNELEEGKNDR
ncbi:NLR family CARD domain-containing protein 3-like [Astyanax mexicanus]|uniref:NLR family CARD domain containing 3 n=1 Tax=Astyanax mexicanus TaxID=7994 RepID=A0A8B9LIG2_ASTMX|nr:NLR family CARD domain-containing protein 3-like [Astyanax mexicanus]